MLKAPQILVRCIALVACAASLASLAACGQKGPLFLPTDPAARERATLPETLGISSKSTPSPAPATKTPADSPKPAATPVPASSVTPNQNLPELNPADAASEDDSIEKPAATQE